MSKDYRKFVTPYHAGWISATVIIGLLLISSAISMIIRNDFALGPQLFLLAIVLLSLIPFWRSKAFFRNIEESNLSHHVEADFRQALPMRKGSIRFGQTWIHIRHSGRLLRYNEIKQLYQYIHKTNFVETERALKYVDDKGKHRVLCKLETYDKSREEMLRIISIILSQNPNIKIGYR